MEAMDAMAREPLGDGPRQNLFCVSVGRRNRVALFLVFVLHRQRPTEVAAQGITGVSSELDGENLDLG